jgi:serine protease Do
VPGQVLRMRIKRGTRAREYPVTVASRPQAERNVSVVRSTCSSGAVCETSSQFNFTVSPAAPSAPLPPPPPTGVLFPSTGIAIIGGVQLSIVDEEFAQSLGVEPGLLVMRAPAGTPASDAGLRAGDVVRAVNGVPVRDFTLLRRAFAGSGPREVKLTVAARGASSRTVTVRW